MECHNVIFPLLSTSKKTMFTVFGHLLTGSQLHQHDLVHYNIYKCIMYYFTNKYPEKEWMSSPVVWLVSQDQGMSSPDPGTQVTQQFYFRDTKCSNGLVKFVYTPVSLYCLPTQLPSHNNDGIPSSKQIVPVQNCLTWFKMYPANEWMSTPDFGTPQFYFRYTYSINNLRNSVIQSKEIIFILRK